MPAGTRLEATYQPRGLHDFFDADVLETGDSAVVLALQQIEMLPHYFRSQGMVDAQHLHLNEQAVGEVDGGDTDRIELLDLAPDGLHVPHL